MTAENDLLQALARQIRLGDRSGFARTGRVIAQSMNDRRRTPWFRSKVEEIAEIWFRGFEACADDLDPITCRQLPSMLRAVDPDWRRRPWGPSLSHIGRKLAKAPMTDEEIAAFLDQLATEDGFREWCVYGRRPSQNGLPVEALISIDGVEILGSSLAPLYRERKLDRWWHPNEVDPERAMMADLLILFARQHGTVNGAILPRLSSRLLPYVRSQTLERLRLDAVQLCSKLAYGGILRGGPSDQLKLTVAQGVPASVTIAEAWLRQQQAWPSGAGPEPRES